LIHSLSGHGALHAASLGGQFTTTERKDPFEYYEFEDYEPYMNE
jgi:hypothetical protein